ncbi:MAG: sensor histidine kinase [Planctomycetota bacterium]
MRSLRGTLLVATALAVGAALLGAGVLLEQLVERALVERVDHALAAEARLLAGAVEVEGGRVDLDELRELRLRDLRAGGPAFLELRQGAALLLRSASLGEGALPALPDGAASWVDLPDGRRARALGLEFSPRREGEHLGDLPTLSLVLARRADDVGETIALVRSRLGLVFGLALVTALLGLWAAVRLALRPLDVLSARLEAIDGDDLTQRVGLERAPRELSPLVARLNELLARLDAAFARERAFSGEVAHELRTPLAGLRTTLEVALQRPREAAAYAETLADAARQLERLEGLVDRLLQLGRLEAASARAEEETVDLTDLLLEVWEEQAARAQARTLRVSWELPEEPLVVRLDPALLRLAWRNLLENAVEYADEGGQVTLRATRGGAGVALEVVNTGSQLDDADAAQATQRFWRGERARTDAGRHCGLGLPLVARATQALGGTLELRSTRGGTFLARLALPGAATPMPEAAPLRVG